MLSDQDLVEDLRVPSDKHLIMRYAVNHPLPKKVG
jgi:hypothetical protein